MRDINLLPEDIRSIEMSKEPAKPMITLKTMIIAAAVITAVAASLLIPRIYIKVLNYRLTSIQEKLNSQVYEEVRTVNKQLETVDEAINNKLDIIEDIDTKGCSANAVLNTIKQCLPVGCSLAEIGINSSSVTVKGIAPNALTASEFVLNIERLGYFKAINNIEKFTEGENNSICPFEFTFTMNKKGGN